MDYQIYEQLSEDGQRLLGYMTLVAKNNGKRFVEHLYLLRHYCFFMFNGDNAKIELENSHILYKSGIDTFTNSPIYSIRNEHYVPALCYMYEKRKDLFSDYKKVKQNEDEERKELRKVISELVDSNYTNCPSASLLTEKDAELLLPITYDKRAYPLLTNLSANTFNSLFSNIVTYLIDNDIVCNAGPLYDVLADYKLITEANRCQFIAAVDLYNFIAHGKMPAEGIYQNIYSGFLLAALKLTNTRKYDTAYKMFASAERLMSHKGKVDPISQNAFIHFLYVVCMIHLAKGDAGNDLISEGKESLENIITSVTIRTSFTYFPSKILAEDHLNFNKKFHEADIKALYRQAAIGEYPKIYGCLAFLLAKYLGYSTNKMPFDAIAPNMALLKHEMSKYTPFDDDEREELRKLFGDAPSLTSIYHKAAWEFLIEDLENELDGKAQASDNRDTRLMYVRPNMQSDNIIVREQTRNKNGEWGNGRVISENAYYIGDIDSMNDADRRIYSKMKHSYRRSLKLEDVVEEMATDERLYFGAKAPFEKVKVDIDVPYLIVEKEHGLFVVKSNVPIAKADKDIVIIEDSTSHYTILSIPSEIHSQYVRLLQLGSFPLEAEGSLRALLPKFGGKMEIHSTLIEGGSTLPIVDGTAKAGFKITKKQGLNYEIECVVRPLEGGKRTYKLGEGNDVIIDENSDGRVRVRRDLEKETDILNHIRSFWASQNDEFDPHTINVYPPEFIIELLQFVQANKDTLYAEWQEGKSMKFHRISNASKSWSGAAITDKGQWFDIEGSVMIDEDTVMSISQLLELASNSKNNYVKINEDEFIVLSDSLKKQLNILDSFTNRERGKIRISPFSAALMGTDVLSGDIEFKLDNKIIEMRKRIYDSSEYSPEVPAELNATLRPYQKDGFQWIARLNSWGAGALLADDMGLGKTIQTIAFLLLKKDEGPSLVVAPASVAPNWKTELEKFAPSLNSQILNFAINRQQVIKDAGPSDIIITTYGILLSIQEEITAKHWNVACLDEAHIIKNRGAKTSAAAMKIKADNRVMLTGTPVQNHLGELWSLFQFVNPGLLGNYENFSRKYITPIEGYKDKDKQEMLDNIVHPFMLRRTKQTVLKELPEKTEIYHSVELSKEEIAVYEGIRTRAEKLLVEKGEDIDMNVLAEITRLREAACSVELIESKWAGECSKITTLTELLQGVIEGGNRALVFSQFVRFFDLVRRELDKKGMQYFYIDGSVPVKKRTEMVEAFQNGEKAIFLISLKAGGLGLNLTGANYVFHLDPWWNPAIEQQATDRAYRIGQQQAVTVYHLVSKHTIEEKIIRLHQTKRELAENILDGTDISHKLTGKELLDMVRED